MMRASATALRRTAVVLLGICVVLFVSEVGLYLLGRAQHGPLAATGDERASDAAFVLAGLMFAAVGALIVLRQPSNTIGWLLMTISAFWAFATWSSSYADVGVHARPGSLPAPALVMAFGIWMWVPALGVMATFVVLLFPDGHVPSRRWAWLPWASGVVMTLLSAALMVDPRAFDGGPLEDVPNPLAVPLADWVVTAGNIDFVLFPVCMVACAVAAVGRFRHSRGVVRLQLEWLAAAGAFFAAFFGAMLLLGLVPAVAGSARVTAAVNVLLPLTFCTIPLAIGVAVLKYRLYDIDVVINKALVFGTLAFFITAVYVGIVVGVGRLAGGHDRPSLVLSIAATAVVAVAFQPVRERVQRFANRLVYGPRATPYEVLAQFADRVGATYDAAELLPTMARTVCSGLGAARGSGLRGLVDRLAVVDGTLTVESPSGHGTRLVCTVPLRARVGQVPVLAGVAR